MRKIVSAIMARLFSAIFILSADADVSCLRDYDSGRKDRLLDAEKFINGFIAAVRAVASLDDATSWSARSPAIQRVAEFIDFPLQTSGIYMRSCESSSIPCLTGRRVPTVQRVDYLGDERYRYASWYVGERYDAEPDLVIDDGDVASGDGSIVPLCFYFSGGQYKYMLDIGFGRTLGGSVLSMQRRPQPGSLAVLRTDYTDAELRLWGCDDCSMNADLLR